MTDQIENLPDDPAELRRMVRSLQDDLDAEKQRGDVLDTEEQLASARVVELEAKLERLNREALDQQARDAEVRVDRERLRRELETRPTKERLAELEHKADETANLNAQLTAQLKQLEEPMHKLRRFEAAYARGEEQIELCGWEVIERDIELGLLLQRLRCGAGWLIERRIGARSALTFVPDLEPGADR